MKRNYIALTEIFTQQIITFFNNYRYLVKQSDINFYSFNFYK